MNPTVAQLQALWNTLHIPALLKELHDNQPGQPRAQAYDTDRTSSGQGPSDPTFTAATTPNTAAHDLAAVEAAVTRIYTALLTIAHVQDRTLPTHEPRRGDIRNATRGCELHRRAGIEEHKPAHRNTDLGSALPQPLKDPLPLCRACYDFARDNARVPTNEEIRVREKRGKWMVRTTGKAA